MYREICQTDLSEFHSSMGKNTQQYGKNRQRCEQNKFYYAVWQLLLYYYYFPQKFSPCSKIYFYKLQNSMEVDSVGITAILCTSYITTRIVKT